MAGDEQEPWYLAVCMQCNRGVDIPSPVPFSTKEERWEWVDAHLTTSHQVLLLNQTRDEVPWHVAHARETGHDTFANSLRSGCRDCIEDPPVTRLERGTVRRG